MIGAVVATGCVCYPTDAQELRVTAGNHPTDSPCDPCSWGVGDCLGVSCFSQVRWGPFAPRGLDVS